MRTFLLIGALVFGLALVATPTDAQISDNESSAAVLAAYCAASSGLPASNFESYSRELALTISQLPYVAQSRVFEEKMPHIGGGSFASPSTDNGAPSAENEAPRTEKGGKGGTPNASAQGQANAAANSAVAKAANTSAGTNSDNTNASRSPAPGTGGSATTKDSASNPVLNALLDFISSVNDFLFSSKESSRAVLGGSAP